MKLIFTTLCILCSINSWAQMSLPSVFPDMRSINPAVISLRKFGMVKLAVNQDKIDKKQSIEEVGTQALEASEKSSTNINNINLFRGGKGGGRTSEIMFDSTSGKKNTKFTTPTDVNKFDIDAKSKYFHFGYGLPSRWGLQLHYLNYNTSYEYTIGLPGKDASDTIKNSISMPGAKIGKIFGSPSLSLGLTFEYDQMKTTTKSDNSDINGTTNRKMTFFGVALGTGGANGLFELGAEFDPISKRDKNQATGESYPMPMKGSIILERRFGKLILGYKGMAYKGQFIDFYKVVPTELVYKTSGNDLRFENVFNLTYGSDRGLVLGGSIFTSNTKTKETSNYLSSDNKYDTRTNSVGGGIRIGYDY